MHPLDLSPSIFAWPSAPCVSVSPFLSHQDTVIGCVEETHSSVCLLDSHVTTTLHTPDTTCKVFPLPSRSLRDQLDVLQFISVVTLTRARADPAGEGLSPKTVPRFRCLSQVIGPHVIHGFCQTWLQIGGPMTLSLDLMICQNSSQNLGKHLTFITLLSNKRDGKGFE